MLQASDCGAVATCDDAHADQVVVAHELQVVGDVRIVRLEHAV
jgi:hypothetical protein